MEQKQSKVVSFVNFYFEKMILENYNILEELYISAQLKHKPKIEFLPGQMSGILLRGSDYKLFNTWPIEIFILDTPALLRWRGLNNCQMERVVIDSFHITLEGIPAVQVDNRQTCDYLKKKTVKISFLESLSHNRKSRNTICTDILPK